MGKHHPPLYFLESIVNPSAVVVEGPGFADAAGRSTMPAYPDLTAAQLQDLVAFLAADGGRGGRRRDRCWRAAAPYRQPAQPSNPLPAAPPRRPPHFWCRPTIFNSSSSRVRAWFRDEFAPKMQAFDGVVSIETVVDRDPPPIGDDRVRLPRSRRAEQMEQQSRHARSRRQVRRVHRRARPLRLRNAAGPSSSLTIDAATAFGLPAGSRRGAPPREVRERGQVPRLRFYAASKTTGKRRGARKPRPVTCTSSASGSSRKLRAADRAARSASRASPCAPGACRDRCARRTRTPCAAWARGRCRSRRAVPSAVVVVGGAEADADDGALRDRARPRDRPRASPAGRCR